MYIPSTDTFLLADCIANFSGEYALEIGVGSGYITNILCKKFKYVFGTDIDFSSVKYSKHALEQFNNKFLICCDICEPIAFVFDIIVCNPPYLPLDDKFITDHTIYGGITGVETTMRILNLYKSNLNYNGKIVFIKSSLSDNDKIDMFIKKNLLKKRVLATKKFFFETLEVYEITKKNLL
ncbi:MAG: HemK2/MTQ2 family protein methyltransferase [Candidatus Nitrosocosmicus sp.]